MGLNHLENDLPRQERHIWETMPVADILSTSDFPIEWMVDALKPSRLDGSRGIVVDAGSGGNPRKSWEMRQNHITPMATDINIQAIDALKSHGLFAEVSDATVFGSGDWFWLAPGMIETVSGVLFQATLNSLLGQSWKNALEAADVTLHPTGSIFVSLYLAGDKVYEELAGSIYSKTELAKSAESWGERYRSNFLAFNHQGMHLPYRAFAVGKPGESKQKYDWTSDPKELRAEYWAKCVGYPGARFERFSQHIDMDEFESFVTGQMGYIVKRKKLVMRPSRTPGIYSPGVNYTLNKPEFFRYQAWRYGLSCLDPNYWEKSKRRECEVVSPMHPEHSRWSNRILVRNLPPSQRRAMELWGEGNLSDGFPI
ncbi:MAG: hypothetical protein WAV40_01845 [Microgenomates group bacterium]